VSIVHPILGLGIFENAHSDSKDVLNGKKEIDARSRAEFV
jgi:hypothetical protein